MMAEQETERRFVQAPTAEAFDGLFALWFPKLERFYLVRGCDRATAEDLAQEALFTVYRHAGAVRQHDHFRPWLIKVARNVLLQHVRRSGSRVAAVSLDHLERTPEGVAADPEFRLQLSQVLRTLSADEQQMVLLRFVEELDYREIAAALDVPLGTVKWRIHATRAKLMAALQEGSREEHAGVHLVPEPGR
jgi:RNA polymerase sigma-70 factor, ECF subfamily